MGFPKTEEEWARRASDYIKLELKRAEVTYAELAKRLSRLGLRETEASIANKLKRGTFRATFLLAVAVAIRSEAVRLEDI